MSTSAQVPADRFLDQVVAALTATDAATLRRLEDAAPHVAAPTSSAGYLQKHATLVALLEASARNLRLLRRVASK